MQILALLFPVVLFLLIPSYQILLAAPDGQTSDAKLGSQFQLKINQTALVRTANVTVTFLNVTGNSRCPSDVVCVWQGQVTVKVKIMKDNQGMAIFDLTAGAGDNNGSLSSKRSGKFYIRLGSVEPYPKSNSTISYSDYLASMIVSKINANSSRVLVIADGKLNSGSKQIGDLSLTNNSIVYRSEPES